MEPSILEKCVQIKFYETSYFTIQRVFFVCFFRVIGLPFYIFVVFNIFRGYRAKPVTGNELLMV